MTHKKGGLYIFSVLVVLLSFVVVLAPELGHGLFLLEILGHYRLQTTVLLLLPFLFFIVRHFYISALGQIICVLLSFFIIMNAYALKPPQKLCSSAQQPQSIRVLSFNTYYMNRNYEEIVSLVERVDADFVLLLETQSGLYHHGHKRLYKKYPFYYADIEKGVEQGKSFYSKYPIESVEAKKLGSLPRGVLDVQLNVEGERFNFMGIHAASPKNMARIKSRNAHIAALSAHVTQAFLASDYVIVSGDFNATPWHSAMRHFKEETGLNNGSIYNIILTWPSWLPSFLTVPIDHIFHSNNFNHSIYHKGLSSGSDHYPLYVDLEWCK